MPGCAKIAGEGEIIVMDAIAAQNTTNQAILTTFVILGFVIVFPIMWIFVVKLISMLSGWADLANRYAASSESSGFQFISPLIIMAMTTRYKRTCRVTFSSGGIDVRTLTLFKIGHKPLFFPWHMAGELERSAYGILSFESLPILVDGKRVMRISLNDDAKAWLQQHQPQLTN
jgi:hypothetical protein